MNSGHAKEKRFALSRNVQYVVKVRTDAFGYGKQYMRSAFFRDVTQRMMVIPHRHLGTTYRPHLKGHEIQSEGQGHLVCSLYRGKWVVAIGLSKQDANQ